MRERRHSTGTDNKEVLWQENQSTRLEFDQLPTLSAALGKLVEAIDAEAFVSDPTLMGWAFVRETEQARAD